MSLSFPSAPTPAQAAKMPRQVEARSDDQPLQIEGSFGEVLSRSLAPETETAGETGKARPSLPARRLASNQKPDPADPVNALALPAMFTQIQIPIVPGAGIRTSIDNAGPANGNTEPGSIPLPKLAIDAAVSGETSTKQADVPEFAMVTPLETMVAALPMKPATPGMGSSTQSSNTVTTAFDKTDEAENVSSPFPPDTTNSMAAAGALAIDALDEGAGRKSDSNPAPDPMALNYGSPAPTSPVSGPLQGPSGTSTQAPSLHTSSQSITPEVGSREWSKALGQQVIHMSKAGHQVAELQLNPPGLGPLKITLSMHEHQMQATFVSEHSSVRAAVEAALPQLRNSLTDSGISLGNTSVGSDTQQQAAFAQNQGGSSGYRSSYQGSRTPDSRDLAAPSIVETPRRVEGITVDTYA